MSSRGAACTWCASTTATSDARPTCAGRPPTIAQLLLRSRRAARYTLADMADDTAGLLRELELAPAHVIGASMGGMIAQTLAARHPRAVRSLVSIMSSTGSRRSGQPALRVYPIFLRRPPRGREAFIAHVERLFAAIGSRGLPQDPEDMRAVAAASYDRDHDPAGPGRQLAAIIASGDRTAELRRITAPTLVIHGTADPLVSPSGGRATARAIRGAELMTIEGMGHDLPRAVWPRADRRDRRARAAGRWPRQRTPAPTGPPPIALGPVGTGTSPDPSPQPPWGRRLQARRPSTECVRPLEHQQPCACTRTSQCRSWRQCERRYGQRPCSARSIRCSWQANSLISIDSPFRIWSRVVLDPKPIFQSLPSPGGSDPAQDI